MPRVAAVDCGTNSVRLLVADTTGSRELREVRREVRITRLGRGVDATGRIAAQALARTRECLLTYGAMLRRDGAEAVRVCATSAARDAANRDELFAMVRDLLGVDAEVITGEREARLSFAGAVDDLAPDDGPFVVTDVGGGSTELVTAAAAYSADVGCVRVAESHLRDDPPAPAQVAAAERSVRAALAPAFDAVAVGEARTWVAVAGTVGTVAAVALGHPAFAPEHLHRARLGGGDLHATARRLETMTRAERGALGPVDPGRVDVIGAGSLIMRVLADELAARAGITGLVVSGHDVLDGLARECAAED